MKRKNILDKEGYVKLIKVEWERPDMPECGEVLESFSQGLGFEKWEVIDVVGKVITMKPHRKPLVKFRQEGDTE